MSIHQRAKRVGICMVFGGIAGFTGCTTYVQQPETYSPQPPRDVYVERPAPPPQFTVEVSIRDERDFYEPLERYGRWEEVGSYGRCWVPGHVESGWRPYTNGHWERTEAGWYWVSEEPWGWATYHYGRWDFNPNVGWFWVPQTQWAPAWVSWHRGAGYVGWAPLQPSDRWAASGEIEVRHRDVPQRAYVFVEERRFLETVRPTTVVNNTTIINQTVNITNVKVVNNTVINEGPQTQVIEKASGRKVQPVAARELRRKMEVPAAAEIRARAPARSQQPAQPAVAREAERQAPKPVVRQQSNTQKQSAEVERKAQIEQERRAQENQQRVQEQAERLKQESARQTPSNPRRVIDNRVPDARAQSKEAAKKAQIEADLRVKENQHRTQEDAARDAKMRVATRAKAIQEKELSDKNLRAEAELRAEDEKNKAQTQADRRGLGNRPIQTERNPSQREAVSPLAESSKTNPAVKTGNSPESLHQQELDKKANKEADKLQRPQGRPNGNGFGPRNSKRGQPSKVTPLPEIDHNLTTNAPPATAPQ